MTLVSALCDLGDMAFHAALGTLGFQPPELSLFCGQSHIKCFVNPQM